jgi:archaeal type IV pilus assembly protein PilA
MNTQKIYRRFKQNSKALSPVVASIILIAVTVAVSVVVAAWMGGMTIGLMGNAEQAQVTNVAFVTSGSDKVLSATVRNTGGDTITITGAYIDGVKTSDTYTTGNTIAKGETQPITVTNSTLVPGAVYELKMVTAKGTSVIYSFNP